MENIKNNIIIAIDGFSSCGKSTLAKQVAKALNYIYVDSGAMYRAVTLYTLENGLFSNGVIDEYRLEKSLDNIEISFDRDASGDNTTWLNGVCVEDRIRGLEISNLVSPVSAIGFVREFLVKQQRALGVSRGIVMDGRDIGTVVFADAELKIFLTASPEIRARRRYLELIEKGDEQSYESILDNVKYRDNYDQTREISPLKKADDALDLDNSNLTRDEQREWVLERATRIITKNR